MRNFKKILMVICVFAFLTVGCVLLAYASGDSNTGTVAELNKLIADVEAGADAAAKHTAIIAAGEYLNTKTIDPAEEGYDDAVAKVIELTTAAKKKILDTLFCNESFYRFCKIFC